MRVPRVRFTLVGLLAILACAAALWELVHQIRRIGELRNERALLQATVAANELAQAELRVMSEAARERHAPPEELEGYERSLTELRHEGESLRLRLSQLEP